MPINSSFVDGVYTSRGSNEGSKSGFGGVKRTTEEIIIGVSRKRTNLELCELYKLPKGIECSFRTNRHGIVFCSGNKESCPLKK
ncbi:MAG: hypothetical protein WC784_04145 [Candidatus Shapirobacteria bacterium]|jgi:hypothetical protein